MDKELVYVTWLEGALNAVEEEYPNILSIVEVQKQLGDQLFQRLQKQLHNSVSYLYYDPRVMYPQLIATTQKAESEQEDIPGQGVQIDQHNQKGKTKL